MKTITGDQLRGHLETMILSSLEWGEAHGLEILHRLEAAGCGLLRLKEGSLIRPSIVWKKLAKSRPSGRKKPTGGAGRRAHLPIGSRPREAGTGPWT